MYGKYSEEYEYWARCYDPAQQEINKLTEFIDFTGKTILEIGCGTGRFTSRVVSKANSIIAIDNDPESIEIANKYHSHNNVTYLVCDACALTKQIRSLKYDIVIYSWSLNYIEDLEKAFTEAKSVLSSDGKLLIMYTALGEYEQLMSRVIKTPEISNENYHKMKKVFKEFFCIENEGELVLPFVFNNIDQAVKLNIMFFIYDSSFTKNNPALPNISTLLRELLERKRSKNGEIIIFDTVKILVGKNN